ncbi:hypothetical protein NPS01_11380 [Nocardioides psychrotolerans]|uniref:Lipoprotein n=2 Tax=Nocardioides psychrotolerans TaxID=1005945 RepID=A0A1I3E8D1_9ACTN|nr:hypothetical protein NPS01_11380 [Nocardioides psychrotolerans]SFH95103.1 hypothetical protein SAMN05216561_103253 [Nocardioides psychrotolerans]
MQRMGVYAGVVIATLTLASCGSDPASQAGQPPTASPSVSAPGADTSTEGHIEFGCALQRGTDRVDAITRHYADLASRDLFRAALQADQGSALAARLWSASDEARARSGRAARDDLLATCSAAGFDTRAGLPELRSYLCAINADLVRDRPTLDSFGPEATPSTPGDARRTDASFVGTAQFLLAVTTDPQWLEFQNFVVALDSGDDEAYQSALRDIAGLCATS